ncbi:MAG TPA: copper amine oxidase N-terminal domain-containing protein [Candidatus Cybelea sp.]|nr:copper amine oxidase N-terminal domain-containing protein [Candidatus Cybelea sp.]
MKWAAALLLLLLATAGAPRPIGIVINGDALSLDPPPRFEHNLLYVPVRRTIEALGLDFQRSGDRITTEIGSKTVVLSIGSRDARIDAATVSLEGPTIEVKDVLYVPLRFFTDVLGAQAHYDRRANTVNIVAQLVGRTTNGFLNFGHGYERFGTVVAVDVLSDPPSITLGDNGGVKTIHIAPNAAIDVEDVNVDVTSPGELGDVRPGDFARVEMNKQGRVQRIVDEYGSRNGHIVAIAGNQFVLDDGQVIAMGRTTEVSLNGAAAGFVDLRPSDQVSIRYNVETNEVREVLASRRVASAAQRLQIASVQAGPDRPLRAGDSLRVVLQGTPGASATFDIGSDVTNQAMHESSSGVYDGSYVIPRGASFDDVALIGKLSAGTASAQAPAPQTISASGTPPGIGDFAPDAGATINTNRPAVYASFVADAVPVNPASALLWINGRDVTSECVRTAQFIQYMPSYSYPNGNVRVTVRVADLAGNVTSKSWSFTIRGR